MSDTVEICREAWQGSKAETQANYDDLSETYRAMLSARAQPNIDSGIYLNDPLDTLHGFDVLVFDISHPRTPPEEAIEEDSGEEDAAPKKPRKPKVVKKTK